MAETAYTRVKFDDRVVNARTRDALKYAQKLWRSRGGHSKSIRLAQGSYTSNVDASGSTHDGGGVVDVRTAGVGLDAQETKDLLRALRDSGFACWIRDSRDGMDPHIHAIACSDKEMSASAKRQVEDFDRGKNALTNGKADRNSYRPKTKLRFSYKQGKPVTRA